MKKIWFVILAVMLLSVKGFCEDATQAPKEFGGIVAGVESMSAVVEAIDPVTRAVTLKDADGKEATVIAGPEVRNFAQIQKGDKVTVDYSETVKILVSGVTGITPERRENLEVARAPLGEKPAGAVTASTQIFATVEAIDYVARTVTVKGPQRTLQVQVNEGASNFENVKVGDSVYVEYTQRAAISVTK